VKITFDPPKRQAACAKEGSILPTPQSSLTVQDTRQDYGEDRFQTVGYLAGRMVMVVWTPRGQARHVISMRKCNDREQATYQKRLGQI
jgi:uncharacterized protein